ncbi:hypothetical protein B0H34DRAFT_801397 [Crassisporium funariophilum]|nr:hypothetical protein B0H34DRAFT_801397 [Crassisporium funariophilum]
MAMADQQPGFRLVESESDSPSHSNATTTPATASASASISVSSFLGYMQRRLSDFVAPDARPSPRLIPGSPNHHHHHRQEVFANEGVAVEEGGGGGSNEADALNFARGGYHHNHHVLKESPSLHRSGLGSVGWDIGRRTYGQTDIGTVFTYNAL